MARLVIKDSQWELIKPFVISQKSSKGERPREIDDRLIVEAVLYVMREQEFSGAKCPQNFRTT